MSVRSRTLQLRFAVVAVLLAAVAAVLVLTRTREERGSDVAPAVRQELPVAAPVARAESESETAAAPLATPVAPSNERREVPLGLRGRVATAAGEGVPGVTVEVRFLRDVHAFAKTDRDGAFALPADAHDPYGSVHAEKEGWRIEPERVALREIAPDAELAFTAEELELVPFRALVVDGRTGEPVPRLGVRVRGEPDVDLVATTDDAGRVALETQVEAGRVDVSFLGGSYSDPGQRLDLRLDDADEIVLRVDVGPTYDLDLELSDGVELDDLRALLVAEPHPVGRAVARALECGAPLPEQWDEPLFGADSHGISAAVLADGPRHGGPWARFDADLDDAAQPRRLDGGYELLIEGGGVAGRASVPNLFGICPETVHVQLAPAGGVEGRVTYPPFEREESGLTAAAALLGSDVRLRSRFDERARPWITLRDVATGAACSAAADWAGTFAFHGLVPGEYELRAETARGGAAARRVTVPAGEPVEVELDLPIHPDAPFALGVLTSQSGEYTGPVVVELVAASDPSLRFRGSTSIPRRGSHSDERERGLAAVFAFTGVSPATYELRVHSPDGLAWTPASVVIDGPRHDLVFTCEDEADTARIDFDLRDAETGEPVEGDVFAWIDAAGRIVHDEVDRVARTASGRWIAVAHDYAPALGRWAADPASDVVRIEAELERGAGMAVLVVTPWGEPLAGAEVLVDGARMGRTDAGGLLRIPGTSAKHSIEARLPGRTTVPSSAGLHGDATLGMAVVVLVRE